MDEKKNLLIIDCGSPSMTYKMVYYLRDYFNVTLFYILNRKGVSAREYQDLGIDYLGFKVIGRRLHGVRGILFKLREMLKLYLCLISMDKRNLDYVMVKTGYDRVARFVFKRFKNTKKIYFPYDIGLFGSKKNQRKRSEINSERYCFENADYIIHKGSKNELDLIREDEIKNIKGKPIHLLPCCFEEWIAPIKSKDEKLKGLHVTYIGGFPKKEDPKCNVQMKEVAEIIANQGIDYHLYSLHRVRDLHHKKIHIHNPLPNVQLNKKIGNYHFGISLCYYNKDLVDERYYKTTVGNKIFSYLEAGIPVLIDDNSEFMADLVRKYNCGIVVSEKDLTNLREVIEGVDYEMLLEGVKKARIDLSMKKNIGNVISKLC